MKRFVAKSIDNESLTVWEIETGNILETKDIENFKKNNIVYGLDSNNKIKKPFILSNNTIIQEEVEEIKFKCVSSLSNLQSKLNTIGIENKSYFDINGTNALKVFKEENGIVKCTVYSESGFQLNCSEEDKYFMFNGTMSYDFTLRSVDMSEISELGIPYLDSLFYRCRALKEIIWPKNIIKGIVSLDKTFSSTGLNTLDLTDILKENKLKYVTSCFEGSMQLKEVIGLNKFNLSNTSELISVFQNTGFEYLDLESWDVSKVNLIHRLFYGCDELKTIKFKSWKTSRVKVFYQVFLGCTNLDPECIKDLKVDGLDKDISDCLATLSKFESAVNNFSSRYFKLPWM